MCKQDGWLHIDKTPRTLKYGQDLSIYTWSRNKETPRNKKIWRSDLLFVLKELLFGNWSLQFTPFIQRRHIYSSLEKQNTPAEGCTFSCPTPTPLPLLILMWTTWRRWAKYIFFSVRFFCLSKWGSVIMLRGSILWDLGNHIWDFLIITEKERWENH